MLLSGLRPGLAKVIRPIARGLIKLRVTADLVTVVGTVGVAGGALGFFPRGELFWGAVVVTCFVVFDMLDGAVAREGGGSGVWGAFLDSTLDRVGDVAIFGGLLWWFAAGAGQPVNAALCLVCLGTSFLTSYIKARAEGLGMTCNVGIAERAVRIIVILVGAGLTGLGVPYAVEVALWLLTVATAVTVGQRFVEVYKQAVRNRKPA
ncbi:MAG: CDP-alcohol phosphatidyltransferase family protein [Streptosporangiales bacterium]|nr:CDP-alcohol phosphatidyltransferase family protein [Streptosporangiales bacterium]